MVAARARARRRGRVLRWRHRHRPLPAVPDARRPRRRAEDAVARPLRRRGPVDLRSRTSRSCAPRLHGAPVDTEIVRYAERRSRLSLRRPRRVPTTRPPPTRGRARSTGSSPHSDGVTQSSPSCRRPLPGSGCRSSRSRSSAVVAGVVVGGIMVVVEVVESRPTRRSRRAPRPTRRAPRRHARALMSSSASSCATVLIDLIQERTAARTVTARDRRSRRGHLLAQRLGSAGALSSPPSVPQPLRGRRLRRTERGRRGPASRLDRLFEPIERCFQPGRERRPGNGRRRSANPRWSARHRVSPRSRCRFPAPTRA